MCGQEIKFSEIKSLGLRLAAMRWEKGLTQRQLADEVGVTHAIIGRYETGIAEPSVTMAAKIAKALGMTLADMVPGL
jgi:transcriptional regulator with XRE-family HTH domain